MSNDSYGQDWVDARCHKCPARFDSVASLREHIADEHPVVIERRLSHALESMTHIVATLNDAMDNGALDAIEPLLGQLREAEARAAQAARDWVIARDEDARQPEGRIGKV